MSTLKLLSQLLLSILVCLPVASNAQQIIAFEGLPESGDCGPEFTSIVTSGFLIESPAARICQGNSLAHNGTDWLGTFATGAYPSGTPFTLAHDNGLAFDLHGLDLSGIFGGSGTNVYLTLTGTLGNGGTVSQLIVSDPNSDGNFGPIVDFESFTVNPDFTNLAFVLFEGSNMAIDNIAVTVLSTDSDGDGVNDDDDICPGFDDNLDGDEDGIPDDCDFCPLDADNDSDLDGVCESTDNCPLDANSDQTDSDGDGLGDTCDVCALDADNDADGDGLCGDIDAAVFFRKAKVKFNDGKIKVDGNLSLPPGYWTDNLTTVGTAVVTIGGLTIGAPDSGVSFAFEIKGDADKKWEYEDNDLENGDIKKLKVDWKGSEFSYQGADGLKLKTVFIGGTESALQIEAGNNITFNVSIPHLDGDTIISYDASRNISANVAFEADKPDNKKVVYALPYQLTSTMTIVLTGSVVQAITVGNFYDEGTVKFKLEAQFDPAALPNAGETLPQSLELQMSLGDTVFGYGQLGSGDWDDINQDEWKY